MLPDFSTAFLHGLAAFVWLCGLVAVPVVILAGFGSLLWSFGRRVQRKQRDAMETMGRVDRSRREPDA